MSVRGVVLRCKAGLAVQKAPIAKDLRMMPGKVAVAMHITHEPDDAGLLQESDVENRGVTDVGTVIASGSRDYDAGDVVIIQQLWGKYVRFFRHSGFVWTIVRFLGDAGHSGFADPYDPSQAIMAKVEDTRIRPMGQRLLVKRSGYATNYGGLVLPDGVGDRSGESVVLEVSSHVDGIQKGDRVICHAGSFDRCTLPESVGEFYGCDSKDLAFVSSESVYCVL